MAEINALICEPSGVMRSLWPLSTGLPCTQGVLRTPNQISIADAMGQLLPVCAPPLATWTDGSSKWVCLDIQLSIGPTARAEFRIRTDSPSEIPAPHTPLLCSSDETAITVTTSPLTMHLLKRGPQIFGNLSFSDPVGSRSPHPIWPGRIEYRPPPTAGSISPMSKQASRLNSDIPGKTTPMPIPPTVRDWISISTPTSAPSCPCSMNRACSQPTQTPISLPAPSPAKGRLTKEIDAQCRKICDQRAKST